MTEDKKVQISVLISQTARDLVVKNAPGKHAIGGYPLNAGHFHDFKDLALLGVCVSAAEAGPRYGR